MWSEIANTTTLLAGVKRIKQLLSLAKENSADQFGLVQ